MSAESKGGGRRPSRLFGRARCENWAAGVIGLGIVLQAQPFALDLYTWSFGVIVAGTVGFVVANHLPE